MRWIPPGGSFQHSGSSIDGGFVYVGSGLKSHDGYSAEPALIDPRQKVDWRRPDVYGETMDYWPSYGSISSRARAAYLSWLASGRSDPRAYIGYVFLFFYGLERRALGDLQHAQSDQEMTAIVAEAERLLRLYGANGSFSHYASSFLAFVRAGTLVGAPLEPPAPESSQYHWELPLELRVGLGRFAAAGSPIPAEWALAWLRWDPRAYLRTPAQRCDREFDDLFRLRYQERYGQGMKLLPSRSRIELEYRPASSGFNGYFEATVGDVPDVTTADRPIEQLREVASTCTDELAAYSRALGRQPEARGTGAAAGLLPQDLLEQHGGQAVDELQSWVAKQLNGHSVCLVRHADLVDRWSPGRTEPLGKKDLVALASLLHKLGFGVEPDVRFGGAKPKPDGRVALFTLPAEAPATPSTGYPAAALVVRLASLLAAADGTVTDEERDQLAQHVESVLGLEGSEQVRLAASLTWMAVEGSGVRGLKAKVKNLPEQERRLLGALLLDIATADGQVTPDEIGMLTKLYGVLDLDEGEVFRAVHAFEAGGSGPITVQAAEVDHGARVLPADTNADSGSVRIDERKLMARREDTAAVAALLSDIFEEDATPAPLPPSPEAGESRLGLDAAHGALAAELLTRPEWARADMEAAADLHGLTMIDAAIERINDASIEQYEEPLIEGDDPLEINTYVVEELV